MKPLLQSTRPKMRSSTCLPRTGIVASPESRLQPEQTTVIRCRARTWRCTMTELAHDAQAGVIAIQLPDLHGGTAVVTGASRGIGRAVVEALAAHDVRCFGLANYGFTLDLPP